MESHVTLKLRDFTKISPLLGEVVQDEITDIRAINYSLGNEEGAKQKAVADAMRRAESRARVALADNGRKVGPVRSISLDVKQPVRIAQRETQTPQIDGPAMDAELAASGWFFSRRARQPVISLPPSSPQRIVVTATVQCVFQIL